MSMTEHARAALEAANIAQDPRSRGPAGVPVLHVPLEGSDGWDFEERELPWRWGVCDLCDGHGSHVNPSIDAGGLSADDFAQDPDFAEDYRRGVYDVPCSACGGRTTIPVLDEARCSPEDLEAWHRQCQEEARDRAYELAELRMGA